MNRTIAILLTALVLTGCKIWNDPIDYCGDTRQGLLMSFGYPDTDLATPGGGSVMTFRSSFYRTTMGGRYYSGSVIEVVTTTHFWLNADGIVTAWRRYTL